MSTVHFDQVELDRQLLTHGPELVRLIIPAEENRRASALKTADEILAEVNNAIQAILEASGPPPRYMYIRVPVANLPRRRRTSTARRLIQSARGKRQ